MMDKIKNVLSDDIVKTALWIGLSAGLTSLCSFLLERPELVAYYGVINFVLYALKSLNDRRTVTK
jgi:fluoride ion exporter CrcB/FEX